MYIADISLYVYCDLYQSEIKSKEMADYFWECCQSLKNRLLNGKLPRSAPKSFEPYDKKLDICFLGVKLYSWHIEVTIITPV